MNKKIINHIISQSKIQPKIGVVLGSGLQQLASSLENIKRIEYSDIPSFFDTTVDTGDFSHLIDETVWGEIQKKE